jgi:hypothetical protein
MQRSSSVRRLATILMALALGLSLSACDPREWFVCSLGLCGYALDDVPPSRPRGLVAAGGDRQVTLTWTSGGEADLFGYEVERSSVAVGPYTIVGSSFAAQFTDTHQLSNGVTYFYRVTASDKAFNRSAPSLEAAGVPVGPAPRPRLPAPVLRVRHFFDDQLHVEWDAVPGAREYVLYRRTSADEPFAELVRTSATFRFDDDLMGGVLYRYAVAAIDDAGQIGERSNEAALSIFVNTGPDLGFLLQWGTRGIGPGQFLSPRAITTDPAGNVYVTDNPGELARVQKFSPLGEQLTSWTLPGAVHGVAAGPDGSVYVVNRDRVVKFTSAGEFVSQWGSTGAGAGNFAGPTGIAVDRVGNVYVADTGNARIQRFTAAGAFVAQWAVDAGVVSLATDGDGNVYALSRTLARVSAYTADGAPITSWGAAGGGDGQFSSPEGIVVDVAERLIVTDTGNDRIQMFTTGGIVTYVFGAALEGPTGVAGDCAANVYVLDSGNARVRKFGPATPTACPAVASVAAVRPGFRATLTTTSSTPGTVRAPGVEKGARAAGRFTGALVGRPSRASRALRRFTRGTWRARYDIAMTARGGTAKGTVLAQRGRARLCLAFAMKVAVREENVRLTGSFSTLAGPASVRGRFTETLGGKGFTLRGDGKPGRAVRRSLPARCRALVSG